MKRGIAEAEAYTRKNEAEYHVSERFLTKDRLNLNDLLKRNKEEKKLDKKNNLLIFSAVTGVAAVVFVILSL